jgi:UDP-3-O-[3-hydroxymyristoyl] glucosamine N-acyltransferase
MGIFFSLESLAQAVGAAVVGDKTLTIQGVAALHAAKPGDLTFLTNPKYTGEAQTTGASAILCEKVVPGVSKSFLLASNPYVALARIISMFHPAKPMPSGIQEGARVHPQAYVDPRASIASGATVESGARIGARTVLYPGVYLGENSIIGEDCLIYANVTIRENCLVGNRVVLQPGVVIGSDGFGFAKDGDEYLKIPQVGNVVLEDDVELGANACVDRAALGTTRIGKGTKLDNLVHIAHNVEIGENTVLAGQTGIAGSTRIGNGVTMGGQVGVAGHLKIGDQVTLATRSGVMDDIPEKGVYWGSPTTDIASEMKNVAAYRQLPELVKRLRKLEKTLAELQNRIKNDE